MASLTHPLHHRHPPSHGQPPFSAIRFHSLVPPPHSLHHHPLVYSPLIPGALSGGQQQPSVFLHTPAGHNLFEPFAAAFANSLLGHGLPNETQHLLEGHRSLLINQDSQVSSCGKPLKYGHQESDENAPGSIALAENSPPQMSLASLSSSFSGRDSDGRSCSSSSANQAQNCQPGEGGHNNNIAGPNAENGQKLATNKKQLVRDEAYWERRRKNNDAAKRSRDSRRRKEDEVAVRAVILEQENLRLRFELERLRTEIERHRILAFSLAQQQQQQESPGAKLDRLSLSLFSAGHPMVLAAAAAAAASMAGEANEATMASG